MFRRLILASLLMTACGEESHRTPVPDASTTDDAGAGADASTATPDIVTNVGAACRGANGCMGGGPTCQTMLSLLGQEVPFPGGYCTATCKNHIECGATGECPVGESLKTLTSIPFITADIRVLIEGAAPSQCYERCTSDDQCRTSEGYRCASILSALTEGAGQAGLNLGGFDVSAFLSGPIRDSKYCLPPAPELPDAGPSDAGDANTGDAASGDAAASDAATDGGKSDAGPSDGGEIG